MKTVSVSELKAKALALAEEVSRTGEAVLVTKRGRPIARLVPAVTEQERNQLGHLANTVIHMGDILSPVFDEWNDLLVREEGPVAAVPRKRARNRP